MRALEDLLTWPTADRLLRAGGGPHLHRSVNRSGRALDHARIRSASGAITLAHLDPALQFFNAENVVPSARRAFGEWGNAVVVVGRSGHASAIPPANTPSAFAISPWRWQRLRLIPRLEESPVQDAIIIAGDPAPRISRRYGGSIYLPDKQKSGTLLENLSDWRRHKDPDLISLPEGLHSPPTSNSFFAPAARRDGFIRAVHRRLISRATRPPLQDGHR